jgi:hypothetical protein
MAPQPTKEDKFSFGLWTIGWQARAAIRRLATAKRIRTCSRTAPLSKTMTSAPVVIRATGSPVSVGSPCNTSSAPAEMRGEVK